MEHQPTRGGGKRVPLGSTTLKEDAMSVMVGIDVGAYKHAAAVIRRAMLITLQMDRPFHSKWISHFAVLDQPSVRRLSTAPA